MAKTNNTVRITEATVSIPNRKSFRIYHDMPNDGPVGSFEAAVTNWAMRTKKFTPESLVAYIKSKDPFVTVATEKQFIEAGGTPSKKGK